MIRSWKISFRPDTRNFEVLLRLAAVQLRAIDAIQHGCHFERREKSFPFTRKTPRNLDSGLRNSSGFPLKTCGK